MLHQDRTFIITSKLLGDEEAISNRNKQEGLVWVVQWKEGRFDVFGRLRFYNQEFLEEWYDHNDFPGFEHFNKPMLDRWKGGFRVKARLVVKDGLDRIMTD